MSIEEIQNEIIEDFELLETREDKYTYIIELGKNLSPLATDYKVAENQVKGCQSTVWLHAYMQDNQLIFEGDSDALIVKGLVSLLIQVLSQQKPEDIAQADLFFIDKIGMQQYLTMQRTNGLVAMIKQMKWYAVAFQAKATL